MDCSNIGSEFIGADEPDAHVVTIMQVKTVNFGFRIVNQGKLFLDDNDAVSPIRQRIHCICDCKPDGQNVPAPKPNTLPVQDATMAQLHQNGICIG